MNVRTVYRRDKSGLNPDCTLQEDAVPRFQNVTGEAKSGGPENEIGELARVSRPPRNTLA